MTGFQGDLNHIKIDTAPHIRGLLSTHYDFGGLTSYEQLHLEYMNVSFITDPFT